VQFTLLNALHENKIIKTSILEHNINKAIFEHDLPRPFTYQKNINKV